MKAILKGFCSKNTTIKMKDFENIPAEKLHLIYRKDMGECFRQLADNVEENVIVL
jgi:hypothetical protein